MYKSLGRRTQPDEIATRLARCLFVPGAGIAGLVGALVAVGCGSNGPGGAAEDAGAGSTGGTQTSSGGSSSGSGGGGGTVAASGGKPSGGSTASGGSPEEDASRPPGEVVLGGPGCGFQAAAFCDTFDGPSTVGGRAGELDTKHWSAGRAAPQFASGNSVAMGIGPSAVPDGCRSGLPATVFSDRDTLVCDANPFIASPHLMAIVGAQNYGQNSYRIRQPFDFRGRTGKIVFDADGTVDRLLGWVSVEITEDPINAPSFSLGDAAGQDNDEGGIIPRRAVEVQFQNPCEGVAAESSVGVRVIEVFEDYEDTTLTPTPPRCVRTQKGHLNHFEVEISQSKISVYISPFSNDGVRFEAPTLVHAVDVNLPFSRGYVHITSHNHATLKYSPNGAMDAWVARWDNVAFDGPVLSHTREYEVPDSMTPGENAWNRPGPVKSIGYVVADHAASHGTTFQFKDVNVENVTSAQVSMSGWYLIIGNTPSTFVLKYRMNGNAWHERPLTAGEVKILTSGHSQGLLGQMLDIPVAELTAGDNTLELVSKDIPRGYPPLAANVDLVLKTE